MLRERLERALTTNRAETDPRASDPRLRGRTYAIPFQQVWSTSLALAKGARGWTILQADDLEGHIRVECETRLLRSLDDLEIRIGLDGHALTRVDLTSGSRKERGDLGTNARRIGRFLRHLDRALQAGPEKILDATVLEAWSVGAR